MQVRNSLHATRCARRSVDKFQVTSSVLSYICAHATGRSVVGCIYLSKNRLKCGNSEQSRAIVVVLPPSLTQNATESSNGIVNLLLRIVMLEHVGPQNRDFGAFG